MIPEVRNTCMKVDGLRGNVSTRTNANGVPSRSLGLVRGTSTYPRSDSVVYIHLIFSTKNREPFLRERAMRESTHSYLGEISKRLDCPPMIVGGMPDHVHLLARFGRTITQADWVKELKRASTIWIREQRAELQSFHWQSGYGDFSVSESNLEDVKSYIRTQEEHHSVRTFQDEYRAFLTKHRIEYDERYVWD